ncbi:hypothetical protein OH76DRAFT_1472076 [Lentinus brumalis]|uniref:Fungal-type protein kinase domain-containing protein n=1 Tax=Lentinus brumalis TaxID=2498619 RepID=A0A371D9U3_9APHY|nr:hypothetical protein OH76DRAFT_1472076 [Polyporus brumalis]
MDGKVEVVDYESFEKRYFPRVPDKSEPDELSTLRWSGALRPEKPKDAEEALATFKRWLKHADNDDNRAVKMWSGEPGYQVVVTGNRKDPTDKTKQRADLALYPTYAAPKATEPPKWSAVEDDPFDDDAEGFQPSGERRQGSLCQIMSYASLVFAHQHRKHQYIVVLLGEMARIVRWDHSGVVATEKFNYQQAPNMLSRFFWRLCHMSAAERGHDTTVQQVDSDSSDYELMRRRAENPLLAEGTKIELGQHARLLFSAALKQGPACKIRTRDDKGERCFLVGAPHFASPELAGRATRCYVAIDCSNPEGPFVHLKDAWRVDHDGMEREGDVVRYLNEQEVKGVPTLVCHSDVEDQVTDSQEVWKLRHGQADPCPMKKHRHYRIVVEEVGMSMSRFKNALELIYLLATCIEAHRDAYNAGVVHRDISAGNVLIYVKEKVVDGQLVQERVGLLTDWELSKRTSAPDTSRQPDRIGTWQFMSAYLLNNPSAVVCIPDELEAFFHVLLFYIIRFLPHNCPNVGQFMHDYFDGFQSGIGPGQYYCGKNKQMAAQYGKIPLAGGADLLIYRAAPQSHASLIENRHPINMVLDEMLELFKARYTLLANPECPVERTSASARSASTKKFNAFYARYKHLKQKQEKEKLTSEKRAHLEKQARQLQDHDEVISLLGFFSVDDSLEWPEDDKIADQLISDFQSKKEYVATPEQETAPTPTIQGPRTRSLTLMNRAWHAAPDDGQWV